MTALGGDAKVPEILYPYPDNFTGCLQVVWVRGYKLLNYSDVSSRHMCGCAPMSRANPNVLRAQLVRGGVCWHHAPRGHASRVTTVMNGTTRETRMRRKETTPLTPRAPTCKGSGGGSRGRLLGDY